MHTPQSFSHFFIKISLNRHHLHFVVNKGSIHVLNFLCCCGVNPRFAIGGTCPCIHYLNTKEHYWSDWILPIPDEMQIMKLLFFRFVVPIRKQNKFWRITVWGKTHLPLNWFTSCRSSKEPDPAIRVFLALTFVP